MAFVEPTRTRPRKTVEDLHALPGDVRAELLDGAIYVSPSPSREHQASVLVVARRLSEWAERGGGGRVFVAPFDVRLPSGDVVQPDVLWISAGRLAILRRDGVHGAPDLAVEVVSPSNAERDRIVKRTVFARNGVREYWIVDPETRSLEVFRLAGGTYEPAGWYPAGTVALSPMLAGFGLRVDDAVPDPPGAP
jgi:Uma2 family endonuclease